MRGARTNDLGWTWEKPSMKSRAFKCGGRSTTPVCRIVQWFAHRSFRVIEPKARPTEATVIVSQLAPREYPHFHRYYRTFRPRRRSGGPTRPVQIPSPTMLVT